MNDSEISYGVLIFLVAAVVVVPAFQRHLISRRTLGQYRATAMDEWRAVTAA